MRKQEKVIIWSAYLDSTRTRSEGRRISRNLAVSSPRVSEIREVAERLGLNCEFMPETSYAKTHWMKTGSLKVDKKISKNKTIVMIAKELQKVRSSVQPSGR